MPQPMPPGTAPQPNAGVSVATFSGLKNTVTPEMLTARELSRARNVDLDDLGQLHRRRGRRLVVMGRWHSIIHTTFGLTLGVQDGTLVLVNRDYTVVPLVEGIGDQRLVYVDLGDTLYASSILNSFKLYLPTLTPASWGRVVSPSYQPSLVPAGADFWLSPVVDPDLDPTTALGAVGGRLLGPPPLASFLAWFNGRIYLAAGRVLWATDLYSYDFVDKNAGYRLYEADITGVVGVEDGVYVGTTSALYFVSGRFGEEQRVVKATSGVVPGSMIPVPGELVDPEGRRFPDLPRPTSKAMACMTDAGLIVGLGGGQTYNLTQSQFVFPQAASAAAVFRREDGMNTVVMPLQSNGGPADNARFGDYCEAVVIRGGGASRTPGQPGSPKR